MSGRNLNRYFNVLEAPPEVQAAFQVGRLRLVDASRVVTLPPDRQKELAAGLADGERPKDLLARFFPPRPVGHVQAHITLGRLKRTLDTAVAHLDGRVEKLRVRPDKSYAATMRRALSLINELLAKFDPPPKTGVPD